MEMAHSTRDVTGDEAQIRGDRDIQRDVLVALAECRNHRKWFAGFAKPYLGDSPIEIGSGLGDYAQTWLDTGTPEITVTDRDPSRFGLLERRFGDDPRVHVRDVDVLAPEDGNHSALVAINVLEHIERDVDALASAHRLLGPGGGAVVMLVPAFNFAMSRFDRQVGHYRRYTVPTLRAAYERAGLEVERIHYINAPGLLAWFVGMRLMRMTPQDGPTVRLWDNAVVPVARALENRVRAPFGQSVFAVGRVRG
jgi:ubiquinone/menaquinone biosynthesis C-methylase UbiE